MNLANQITFFRIILIPFFMLFMYIDKPSFRLIAALIFIIAALTDTLDGHIARSKNMITTLGKFLDPLADKMLVASAMIVLVELNELPSVLVVIIIAREFAITGLRVIAASKNITIAASKWGKIKTITQLVGISAMLLKFKYFYFNGYNLPLYIMYIATFATIASGIDYFAKNCKVMIQ